MAGQPRLPFALPARWLIEQKVKTSQIQIKQVFVHGNPRTRRYLIDRELLRCQLAETLGELEEQLEEAIEALLELDVFLAVDAFIEQADEGGTGAVDVHLTLREQGRLGLNVATYAQGQGGSIEGTIKLKNSLGRAEHIGLKYERGSHHHTEVVLSLGRSRIWGTDMSFDWDLYRQDFHGAQQSSSFSLQSTGTTASLQTHDGFHTFTYDLGWLHAYDPSNNASKAVRQQLGWKLKSALKYAFQYSTFPSVQYPTSGFGVRATQEVAGIGPGSGLLKYIKSEIKAAKALYLGGDCVLALEAEAGFITPWGPGARSQPVPITERFRMFGTGSTGVLRGFRDQGIGPVERRRCRLTEEDESSAAAALGDMGKSEDQPPEGSVLRPSDLDYVGADLMCCATAALRFPLPWEPLRQAGLYGHLFTNVGSVGLLSGSSQSLGPSLRSFTRSFRWTSGAGIVWPCPVGLLEINMCRVHSRQQHDRGKTGFSFGFRPYIWTASG